MTEKTKTFRDTTLQLLATVMIPVSVAGTGLYYTRWQQNLNDLKTMIDLVSDERAERRKYGVAMFEYLLKNDKVPVEFVAAQLSFANSSSDKELLPLMEQAMFKASAENPKVAETFRQALERMPSRLFVHGDDKAKACFRLLYGKMDPALRSSMVVADFSRPLPGHQLNVFQDSDVTRGDELVKAFGDVGLKLGAVNLAGKVATSDRNRPNSFQLILSASQLPASCG